MLTKDGKTVLRANYGRYYMPLSVENLRRFGPDMPLTERHMLFYEVPWDIVDVNGNDYVDYNEVIAATRALHGITPYSEDIYNVDTSWQLKVADGVKDQHTDQFTISIERELMKDLSFQGSFIYKRTANLMANWPINRMTGEEFNYERVAWTTEFGETVMLYNLVLEDFNGDGSGHRYPGRSSGGRGDVAREKVLALATGADGDRLPDRDAALVRQDRRRAHGGYEGENDCRRLVRAVHLGPPPVRG